MLLFDTVTRLKVSGIMRPAVASLVPTCHQVPFSAKIFGQTSQYIWTAEEKHSRTYIIEEFWVCVLRTIWSMHFESFFVAFDQVEKAQKTESCDVSLQKHILTFLKRMRWRVFIEPPSAFTMTCAERDIRISVKNGEFDADCESPSIDTGSGDALISQLLCSKRSTLSSKVARLFGATWQSKIHLFKAVNKGRNQLSILGSGC